MQAEVTTVTLDPKKGHELKKIPSQTYGNIERPLGPVH